ncbi:nuclear targeted protein LntA [Listeria sp. FSL L7-0253]|uniref:nuclear targeted protein LntA n=1 Tax=Listeria cossartiae TaxID=2838249 RepID=UPI001625F517|nr:nuclear targeted protein LntA [Listeria cossartiae]MBC2185327.1 nuclear targeted protein LntA [Listeria cossartiae subsp. cossartiae]
MKKLVDWFKGLSKTWKIVVIIGAVLVVILAVTTSDDEGEQASEKANSSKTSKQVSKPKPQLSAEDLALIKFDLVEFEGRELSAENILNIDALKRSSEASTDTQTFKQVFTEWSDFKIQRIQVTLDLLNGKKDSEAAFKKRYPNQIIFKKVRTDKLQTALNNLKVGYQLLDSQK